MTDQEQIAPKWSATQARLPEGWTLEGLRCASTGLGRTERSDDWVAVASGPGGEERSAQARTADGALKALAISFESNGPDIEG